MKLRNAETRETQEEIHLPPSVQKAVDIIRGLKDGEFLAISQLSTRIGCHRNTLQHYANERPLCDLRIQTTSRNKWQYVNANTKAEWDKEQMTKDSV